MYANTAQTMVAVLKNCGDNLTRENVMKQANMKDTYTTVCSSGRPHQHHADERRPGSPSCN